MNSSEGDYLVELSKANICPNCGKAIEEGKRVIRGTGTFCSLECIADYHKAEFVERVRRLRAAQHQ
jgi:hypothetical protein